VAGSIILAGILLKMGIYGIYRVYSLITFKAVNNISIFILSVRLYGAVLVALGCLGQVDIKVLIAYSSVVHISLCIVGIFSKNIAGAFGRVLILLGHGLCSSALFFMANIFYERIYTRSLMLLKGHTGIFPVFLIF
jgi:NADH:ubiquinone oxidoreductase subunit 4 (subunit M)